MGNIGRDAPGNSEKRPAETVAPGVAAWTPSERVLALTPVQVAETRERLSVVVEQDASLNKEPLIGPIESFDDMVRLPSWIHPTCVYTLDQDLQSYHVLLTKVPT